MTSARQLQNLHCAHCADTTLHNERMCIRCETPRVLLTTRVDPISAIHLARAKNAAKARAARIAGRQVSTSDRAAYMRAWRATKARAAGL